MAKIGEREKVTRRRPPITAPEYVPIRLPEPIKEPVKAS